MTSTAINARQRPLIRIVGLRNIQCPIYGIAATRLGNCSTVKPVYDFYYNTNGRQRPLDRIVGLRTYNVPYMR